MIIQISDVARLEVIFLARYPSLIAWTMRLLNRWPHSNKIKLETTACIRRYVTLVQRMNLVWILADRTDSEEPSHILVGDFYYLRTFLSITLKELSTL